MRSQRSLGTIVDTFVDGHKCCGRVSQTVNVCTEDDRRGYYDWTVRVNSEHFVTGDDIRGRADTGDLITWLTREKLGQIEFSPSGIDIDSVTEEVAEPQLSLSPSPIEP